MKNSPTEPIKKQLEALSTLNIEAEKCRTKLANVESDLASLISTGNLDNEETLNRIGRLEILSRVLPARIAEREQARTRGKEDLQATCHDFIEAHLGPRLRELAINARAKVKATLSKAFATGFDKASLELDSIVESSDLVHRITLISASSKIQTVTNGQYIEYANDLISNWNSAEAISAEI